MGARSDEAVVGGADPLPLGLPASQPGRYSVHGGRELDDRIQRTLDSIARDLRTALGEATLDGLVLGGGYGRGEGGVLLTQQGPLPFNDLDLVLIHHGRDHAAREAAAKIGLTHGPRAGVHVDVTPLQRDGLARLPPTLTWYELSRGHQVVWGRPDLLAPLAGRTLREVHPTEWGRLLTNRAFGVALSRRLREGQTCPLLDGESPRAVETRHIQKAWLALGDVWLADRGLYSDRVVERATRFERAIDSAVEPMPPWSERYRAAMRFKLLPSLAETVDGQAELDELAELLARELAKRHASPPRPIVGLVATARSLPPSCWWRSPPWRHPRERLRLALVAELEGRFGRRDALCGSAEALVDLWQACG